MGACPNETIWTVPESLSWSICSATYVPPIHLCYCHGWYHGHFLIGYESVWLEMDPTVSPTSTTKMIPEIWNHNYNQRIQDLILISLVQRRLRGELIEVFKYLNRFTTASARELFDYDLNDRTRKNGAKLIVEHFNRSVATVLPN